MNFYCTPIQLKLPLDIEKIIDISDPVYTFCEVISHIDLNQYLAEKEARRTGRPPYDREILLKVVLFAFMEQGYPSLRMMEKLCRTDIRFLWLLDGEPAPSYATICTFINTELMFSLDEIADDINAYIFAKENVDLTHAYLDGTKIEARSNKYTWVWKKSSLKGRLREYAKLSELITGINETVLAFQGIRLEKREEYSIEYIYLLLGQLLEATGTEKESFVHGRGHRKGPVQKAYEGIEGCCERLKKYALQIRTCGEKRNSYSKTDHDATFMRMKKDYMGNDQLLPAYNVQLAVCDGYIAAYGVYQYASDMDCFQPMMEEFKKRTGRYPEYPIADAGYGSYNNYLFCEEHGMKKYMKFPMYEKETKDRKHREDPFRACNFKVDGEGFLTCPKGRRFLYLKRSPVRGNQYGRMEEYYQCEDCTGCEYRDRCHKSKGDRIVRINEELTGFHEEVLSNLNSIHGALLRMNRSIQAEGAFGGIKGNRGYKRIRRWHLQRVQLEIGLISCGFNLHKYHLRKQAHQREAA